MEDSPQSDIVVLHFKYTVKGFATQVAQGDQRFCVGTTATGWPSALLRMGARAGCPTWVTHGGQALTAEDPWRTGARFEPSGRFSAFKSLKPGHASFRTLCPVHEDSRAAPKLLDVWI